MPRSQEHNDWADRLADKTAWSASHRTLEADLRHDLFLVLQPYAVDALGIPPGDVRQEGTGTAGRYDSLFGRCERGTRQKRCQLIESETSLQRLS